MAMYKLLRQWRIILLHFLCRWRMGTWKVIDVRIVLAEQRFKMCQMVIFSEQSPDAVIQFRSVSIPLMGLYVGKLFYEGLIDYEMLIPVCPW